MIDIKIINKSSNPNPSYGSQYAAGFDLRANLEQSVVLKPLERFMVPTGIFLEIPTGYEGQVRPRSGLATKSGITVANSPGTVDSDYRGEVKVCLINLSNADFTVSHGDRVAQMIISKHETANFIDAGELATSERGESGFGSTGIK